MRAMPAKRLSATNQAMSANEKAQGPPGWTEIQARAYFEKRRWPRGPQCPFCAGTNVYRVGGTSHRAGLIECRDCRQQFTVTVRTLMQGSRLPLSAWAKALHYLTTDMNGCGALELQRKCGIGSYRSAWLLVRRLAKATHWTPLSSRLQMANLPADPQPQPPEQPAPPTPP
jgi:transposase-like protein